MLAYVVVVSAFLVAVQCIHKASLGNWITLKKPVSVEITNVPWPDSGPYSGRYTVRRHLWPRFWKTLEVSRTAFSRDGVYWYSSSGRRLPTSLESAMTSAVARRIRDAIAGRNAPSPPLDDSEKLPITNGYGVSVTLTRAQWRRIAAAPEGFEKDPEPWFWEPSLHHTGMTFVCVQGKTILVHRDDVRHWVETGNYPEPRH